MVGDGVLGAVARGVAHRVLPGFAGAWPLGALAERHSDPFAGVLQLALGELVAECGALAGELGDRALDALAFGAGLGGVAELVCQCAALGEGRVQFVFTSVEGACEVGVFDGVRVVLAAEAPARCGEGRQARSELLTLGADRGGARVEVLDPSQGLCGERGELRLQLLDALA